MMNRLCVEVVNCLCVGDVVNRLGVDLANLVGVDVANRLSKPDLERENTILTKIGAFLPQIVNKALIRWLLRTFK
jgi:hypothetical protein